MGLVAAAASAQVKYDDILAGPGANWLTYAGSYSGQRHSSLTQINTATAKNLTPKWVYHVPDAKKLESVPVVYDGILYVTNSNQLHALDARTGRKIWVYRDEQAEGSRVNRGPAILGDKVYFVTTDCHLVALHRKAGAVLWHKSTPTPKTATSPPWRPLP
jgi:alcohol dehydrogenase (cytochrome c)